LKHVETENNNLRNTNIILKGELSSCEEENYKLDKTINSLKEQLEDYEKLKEEFVNVLNLHRIDLNRKCYTHL
jgi:hypothetical protein